MPPSTRCSSSSCLATLALALFFSASVSVFGCGEPAEPASSLAERLQAELDDVLQHNGGIGASAAVSVTGEPTWLGTSGVSHGGVPISPDMLFCIASVTKTFTAAVIMQLVDEALLTLDDTVGAWLPPYPYRDGSVTVRQLLNHTSGVYNISENPGIVDSTLADLTRVWSPEEILNTFMGEPYFPPGTDFHYSNTNYLLLGMIIEKVTGSAVVTQFRDRLLDALDLNSTFLSVYEPLAGVVAHRWADIDDDGAPDDLSAYPGEAYDSQLWTAGGLYSTAGDLVRWSRALFQGEVVSASSLAQMLDFYEAAGGRRYGLGIEEFPGLIDGVEGVGHGGSVIGFRSRMLYLPDAGIHVAVLTNSEDGELNAALSSALARVALEFVGAPQ